MTPGGCCESTLGETGMCAPCLPVHPGGGGHMGLGKGGGGVRQGHLLLPTYILYTCQRQPKALNLT